MALIFWSAAAHTIGMLLAGWIDREQEAVIVYQKEEIRALREMLGGKRLRFTDAQRRRLEPISEMPQQDAEASEVDEAEEVLGVPLPTRDEPAVVVEPREQSFDQPAALVAT